MDDSSPSNQRKLRSHRDRDTKVDANKKDVLEDYDIIMMGDSDQEKTTSTSDGEGDVTTAGTIPSGSATAVSLIRPQDSSDDGSHNGASNVSNSNTLQNKMPSEGHSKASNKNNSSMPTIVSTLDVDTDFVDINVVKNSDGVDGNRPQPVICPHVNCPEKIVFCLDLNNEMNTTVFRSRAGDKYSGLELAKRAIKMFVLHKSQMNPNHEFAFLVFHEESTMIQTFTRKSQEILRTLEDIEITSQQSGPLNLNHMFETIKENVTLPEIVGNPTVVPPAFIVRVLLVFGRSQCVPIGAGTKVQRELESSPHFFTDVLYIHEPPSEQNKCEEIFQALCDLDHNGLSYIFEQSKYTPILNSGAKLLAHPLQRPQQLQASYKIGNGPMVNQPAKEERMH